MHTRGSVAVRCRDPCIRDKRIIHAYILVSTLRDIQTTHTHTQHIQTRVHKEREREKSECRMNESVVRMITNTRHTCIHARSVLRDPPNSHQTHCIKSSRVGDEARGRPTECSRMQIRANFDRVKRDLNERGRRNVITPRDVTR